MSSMMDDRTAKCSGSVYILESLHGIINSNFSTLLIWGFSLEFHEDPSSKVLLIFSHFLLSKHTVKKSF